MMVMSMTIPAIDDVDAVGHSMARPTTEELSAMSTPTSTHVAPGATMAGTPDLVMDLLDEHVPLTLLIDLTSPQGPDSQAILDAEGVPDEVWWE